jgi:hypothetical protein
MDRVKAERFFLFARPQASWHGCEIGKAGARYVVRLRNTTFNYLMHINPDTVTIYPDTRITYIALSTIELTTIYYKATPQIVEVIAIYPDNYQSRPDVLIGYRVYLDSRDTDRFVMSGDEARKLDIK